MFLIKGKIIFLELIEEIIGRSERAVHCMDEAIISSVFKGFTAH